MKKWTAMYLLFLFVLVTGCSPASSEKPDSVLEIDSGQGNLEADLNHKNLISAEPEVFLNESVQKNRTLTLDGVRLDLNYQDSLYYPVGGETVNRYLVDGKEDQPILLDEKGNIHSILYHFAKLSILPTDSYEDVLEPLKEELSKTFDLSYYKEQIPLGSAMGSRGFGMYDYFFCNRSNGYITDSLRVSVSEDGSVLGLRIRNFTGTCDLSRIDKNRENERIEQKLKDIYQTENTQLQDFSERFHASVVLYNGETYLRYIVGGHFLRSDQSFGFLIRILIPLSDLCS